MQHHALDERHALAETLRRVGPDSPTLCGEWTTTELAAHLVLRERSVAEAVGRLPITSFKRRAERVVTEFAASEPYDRLVAAVDRGPSWRDVAGPVPTAWAWSIPLVREQANVLEYVVHHEDVRRALPDWLPRSLSVALQQTVWTRLRMLTRITLRSVPVGLVLHWPSHGEVRTRAADRGSRIVTVTGDPVEVAMFAFGRLDVARVDYDGTPDDVQTVRAADITF